MTLNTEVILKFLIPIVITLIGRAAFKESLYSKAKVTPDGIILSYGTPLKIISFIFVGISLGIYPYSFFVQEKDFIAMLVMGSIFSLLSIPLLLEVFFVNIELKKNIILTSSPWKKSRAINIDDIKNIKYSPSLQWWKISTRSDGNIFVHSYLTGADDFLKALTDKEGS